MDDRISNGYPLLCVISEERYIQGQITNYVRLDAITHISPRKKDKLRMDVYWACGSDHWHGIAKKEDLISAGFFAVNRAEV